MVDVLPTWKMILKSLENLNLPKKPPNVPTFLNLFQKIVVFEAPPQRLIRPTRSAGVPIETQFALRE